MRISTTDPMTLNGVIDTESAPFVTEGEGEGAIEIYFESENNRDEYLAIELHGSGDLPGLRGIFDAIAENPNTGSIN